MVIGLFAMSQAFVLLETRTPPRQPADLGGTGRFAGLWEVFRYRATVIRSSLLGIVMGLLPGVGEFGAQFLSYSLARRFSKKPEEFGKGSPEGLVASETSINACTSTVLVPLLALGIPADPLMAMLLAVFMIHNIIPGPQLFIDHADFISGLYISLFLLNVFVLILLLAFTKHIVRLSSITPRVIGAAILVLGFIGTYTQNFRITALHAGLRHPRAVHAAQRHPRLPDGRGPRAGSDAGAADEAIAQPLGRRSLDLPDPAACPDLPGLRDHRRRGLCLVPFEIPETRTCIRKTAWMKL